MERRLAVALVLVAVVLAGVLALAPLGGTTSCSSTSTTAQVCTSASHSLLDEEGSSVLVPLAIPVLLAGAAVAARTRRARTVLAGLVTAFAVLAMMTIGVFLVPIVALMWALAYSTSARSAAK